MGGYEFVAFGCLGLVGMESDLNLRFEQAVIKKEEEEKRYIL